MRGNLDNGTMKGFFPPHIIQKLNWYCNYMYLNWIKIEPLNIHSFEHRCYFCWW